MSPRKAEVQLVVHARWAWKPGRRRWLLLPAAALALALGGAAVLTLRARNGAAARAPRVVRIGYAVEAPYVFLDAEGRVTGESAASAGLIARKLGWLIEWVQTDFDLLIADLVEERFDLVDAGLFVTRERARLVSFAAPRLRVVPALLVRSGNPLQVHSWREVQERRELKLAVVGGSVEELRLAGMKRHRLLRVPDAQAGAAVVRAQLADAMILSLPSVRLAAAQSGLEAVPLLDADRVGYVATAFRPDDAGLLRDWNRAQAAVVGTPEHLAAIAPFGFMREDVVVPAGEAATR